jgi:hypothetical protein
MESFGCEFELHVPYLLPGEMDPDLTDELPPVLRLAGHPADCQDAGEAKVSDILQEAGFRSFEIRSIYPVNSPERWVVKDDGSLNMAIGSGGYGWLRIEVASPAKWSVDEALAEIRRAIQVLKSAFRCRISPRCGFHVHLGNGGDVIPFRTLRRFAALLWAADPLLSRIHPPERRLGYSKSIRMESNLARGRDIGNNVGWETAIPGIGVDTEDYYVPPSGMAEAKSKWDQLPNRYDSAARWAVDEWIDQEVDLPPDPDSTPIIKSLLPYLPPTPITASAAPRMPRAYPSVAPSSLRNPARVRQTSTRLSAKRGNPVHDEAARRRIQLHHLDARLRDPSEITFDEPPVRSALFGAAKLLRCRCSAQVAWLLGSPMGRLNYCYEDYGAHTGRLTVPMARHTIEVREAVGTLDPEWISVWVRILSGIYRFAKDASPEVFTMALMCLAEGQGEFAEDHVGNIHDDDGKETPASYDVIDFLDDITCFAEAEFLEQKLQPHARNQFWESCAEIVDVPPPKSGTGWSGPDY